MYIFKTPIFIYVFVCMSHVYWCLRKPEEDVGCCAAIVTDVGI